jgi:acyl-CoA synthetase (AMP-forming)/AMP-acid ligase II
LTASPAATVDRLDTELAMIIYTSGSTGKPKGVMLSHRNIVTGARSVARYLRLAEDDRLLSVLPYSFDYGLNQLTTMLLMGGTVVHQPISMATEVVRLLASENITGFAAVPPLWAQVVRLLSESKVALPSLRRVTNSGGKVPKHILAVMPQVFPGVDIYLMYGLTEAFRSTYLAPERFSNKMGAIGRAIPAAEIYIIKQGEGIAGPGEQGELVHRGPLVSLGYWGKPEATAEKIRPCPELRDLIGDEPVVYSGDIVRIDDDGDFWFVSRNDTMIKTSGFRVSPDEVEDYVAQSGLVGDVVAYGVDHDDLGQVIHVAVSPLANYQEPALIAHCRNTMPNYMVPSRIVAWDAPMPRTGSGKLAKPLIIEASRKR